MWGEYVEEEEEEEELEEEEEEEEDLAEEEDDDELTWWDLLGVDPPGEERVEATTTTRRSRRKRAYTKPPPLPLPPLPPTDQLWAVLAQEEEGGPAETSHLSTSSFFSSPTFRAPRDEVSQILIKERDPGAFRGVVYRSAKDGRLRRRRPWQW